MQDTMETRGVASVRSPVCNLRQRYDHVDHKRFVQAVVDAFRTEYDVHEEVRTALLSFRMELKLTLVRQVQVVSDLDGTQNIEHVQRGMKELKVIWMRPCVQHGP